ncbi:hypothetical protein H9X57_06565 [Flavobacterium piscinae]|uniref:hypothetical protein n=1 Tax=Flavobacterium piscinae TaxID=2506424 RepID=UPI0019ACF8C8|nr:hypothetical protein [Flavobacterium piscinae]MBC8883186.1 hypothetical protein [Flavobacterium piscinae]
MGPNKIVSGMYALMMAVFSIGLLSNRKSGVNKTLLIVVLIFNLYVLLVSGSRTSYVGILVFLSFLLSLKPQDLFFSL